MHIARILLRHWRRHDEILADNLSERINLVCGPNEAGKSTLAEGLRFALFEPSKPVYEARKAIQSWQSEEPPEVEVNVVIDGATWRIHKRFLRRQMTKLVGPSGQPVEGDDAESQLQSLLGFTVPESGRVTRDQDPRNLGLWPILWLKQGELSGLDGAVTDGVRGKLSELVARQIGSVASGHQGSRALDLVRKEFDIYWTPTGKPTGSYASALKTRDTARERHDAARAELTTFEKSVRELTDLAQRIVTLTPRVRLATEAADEAKRKAKLAIERFQELEREGHRIEQLRRDIAEATKALSERTRIDREREAAVASLTASESKAAALLTECEQLEAAALRQHAEAGEAHRLAKAAQEAADAARRSAERTALADRITILSVEVQRIDHLETAWREARTAVDATADIDQRKVTALRKKESEYHDACVKRNAASTAVSFRANNAIAVAWTADGNSESADLPADTVFERRTSTIGELTIAGLGTVRIRPGAGEAADLAESAREAGDALEQALRKLGVDTVDRAQQLAQERQDATSTLLQAQGELAAALGIPAKGVDADGLLAAIDQRRQDLASERGRLAAMPVSDGTTVDPVTAQRRAAALRDAADAQRDAADQATILAADARSRQAAEVSLRDVAKERVRSLAAELSRLPEATEVARRHGEATAALGTSVNRQAELKAAWEVLGGADAGLEAEDQAAAALRLVAELQGAKQRRDGLDGHLRAAADKAPAAALQGAEADLARAEEAWKAIERQASAAKTLWETIKAVQSETRAALAAPVRAAIEPYLRRIFPGSTLTIGDDDWRVSGFTTDGTAEAFMQLSLGAQEQFALLVRLGLAEVFAQGRRLPLVLDDPLINADSIRREAMISALRHASKKMQILLFTCHEAEHDALAAEKTFSLVAGR